MKITLLPGMACAALATSAPAAVIVSYGMSTAPPPAAQVLFTGPTSLDAGVTATNLVNQLGNTASGSLTFSGGDLVSTWNTAAAAAPVNDNSFSAAFTVGNYLTFSITPTAGNQINLTNITFQASTATTSTTSNRGFFLVSEGAPANFTATSVVLLSDRTAFDGGGGSAGTLPLQASPTNATVPRDYDASLASLGPVTGTQYFRLYLQTPNAGQGLAFDDIVVNGTVTPVPEPGAPLLGLAGLLILQNRRRRQA
jgi:hypothetical protein